MLEAILLAFVAFYCGALASQKYAGHPAARRLRVPPRTLRAITWLLLAASLGAAMWSCGAATGAIAWCGTISLAAICLVLALSWRPEPVLRYAGGIAALLAIVCAGLIMLMQ